MTKRFTLFVSQHFRQLLESSADFYARTVSTKIAEDFLDAVAQAINYIVENPHANIRYIPPEGFPELEKLNYRVFNLNILSPFLYSIYYEVEKETIVIHALYHHSQNREAYLGI